jgi:hypothetical protein
MPEKAPMSIHSTRGGNRTRPDRRRSLCCAFLGAILIASTLVFLTRSGAFVQAASISFVFTAAGDYGSTQNTINTLQFIGKSSADGGPGSAFHLGLGDYNYDTTTSADTWYTTYAKPNLPAAFPFEIVAGDHDTQLSQLTADLPPNGIALGSQSTAYGHEYYFDYPAVNPLTRVLMLTPKMTLPNGQQSGFSYAQGTRHYKWVSQRVSDARSAGIPWVIVGIARGCLFIGSPSGSKACSQADYDLLNKLLSKDAAGHPHADLILQAHLHYYARSSQLAVNTNCLSLPIVPAVPTNRYNPGCVVDNSSSLTKDAGTVIVDTGTGGQSLVSVDGPGVDPRAQYFASSMGGIQPMPDTGCLNLRSLRTNLP